MSLPSGASSHFSLGKRRSEIVPRGGGGGGANFYSARHSLGMQGSDREAVLHIIVLSSPSSRRYAFVCPNPLPFFFFVLSPSSSVCIFVRPRRTLSGGGRGIEEEGKNGIFRSHECKFVLKREKRSSGERRQMRDAALMAGRLFLRACLSTCRPAKVHIRRGLRMRSKANKFIGGLHNSAAIPGVIVFPLRLSCTNESLMHSCLIIMDGIDRPAPRPAAGAGSSRVGEYTCTDCGQGVLWTLLGGQKQAAGICVATRAGTACCKPCAPGLISMPRCTEFP